MALDRTTAIHGLTTDKNMTTDEERLSQLEVDEIADIRAKGASGEITWKEANDQANAIRSQYGYSIDQSGEVTEEEIPTAPRVSRVQSVDTTPLVEALDKWAEQTKATQIQRIDSATEQAIAAAEQSLADANEAFAQDRADIDLDEAKAKDDQALYADLRGDRGGIGAMQYDAIAAAAMKNRQTLRAAQTRLAADTAREMADLRVQGEYEKADALLALSQEYLGRLQDIHQWAADYNLTVEKLNAELEKWEAEYTLDAEKHQLNVDKWQWNVTEEEQDTAEKESGAASGTSSAPSAGEMDIEGLFEAAQKNGGYTWLKQKSNYTKYGLESAPNKTDYDQWLARHEFDEKEVSAIAKGWATDLYKMYPTAEQRREAIEREYAISDGWMTETDYYYLRHKVG